MSVWAVVLSLLALGSHFLEIPAAARHALPTTTFGNHIGQIDGLRSQKKVNWIDAGRIITAMQNEQAVWDRSDKEFVRDMTGQQIASWSGAGANQAIAVFGCAASPEDAARRGLPTSVAKEAVNQWDSSLPIIASPRTESCSVVFESRRVDPEGLAANFTNSIDFCTLHLSHDRSFLAKRMVVVRAGQRLATADLPVLILGKTGAVVTMIFPRDMQTRRLLRCLSGL